VRHGVALAQCLHQRVEHRETLFGHPATDPTGLGRIQQATSREGQGVMYRALGLAKTIGSLLAIEVFVPGGTLVVLTLLVGGRPGSPLLDVIRRRCPALATWMVRLMGSHPLSARALARD
jgi:hypothetical protein